MRIIKETNVNLHHSLTTRNSGRMSAFLVLSTCAAVSLSGCALVPVAWNPRSAEYLDLNMSMTSLCEEAPSADEIQTILSRAWYYNASTPVPSQVADHKTALDKACAEDIRTLDHWLTDDDLTAARESHKKISDHVEAMKASRDDAMAYWEFSYAVLQFDFALSRLLHLQRGLVGITEEDNAFLNTVTKMRSQLENETTLSSNVGGQALRDKTMEIRQLVASIKDYLLTRDAEYGPPLTAGLDPLIPDLNNPLHSTMFPPMIAEEMPKVSAITEDLLKNPPPPVHGYPFSSYSSVGESPIVRFMYETDGGSLSFTQIDDPWERIIHQGGKSYGDAEFPHYTGYGNEVCASTSYEADDCLLQSADGRWWVAAVPWGLSLASSRGILSSWLKAISD